MYSLTYTLKSYVVLFAVIAGLFLRFALYYLYSLPFALFCLFIVLYAYICLCLVYVPCSTTRWSIPFRFVLFRVFRSSELGTTWCVWMASECGCRSLTARRSSICVSPRYCILRLASGSASSHLHVLANTHLHIKAIRPNHPRTVLPHPLFLLPIPPPGINTHLK